MIRVSDTVDIGQPIETVFAFLADVQNFPRWQSGVVSSRSMSEGPMRLGTRFTESMRVMGMTFDANCEVSAFEPPHRMAFVADGRLVRYEVEFTFQPTSAGTRLSVDGQVAFKGFWRLLSPLMNGEIRKEIKTELANIETALQSST